MARKIKALVAFVLILSLVTNPLQAGCGHFFHHKKVVVAVQAVAVPVYQVGTDLEIKAAVEAALRQREAYAAQQAFNQQQAQLKAYQQQQWGAERKPQQPVQQTAAVTGPYDQRSLAPVVFTKCGQCHATANSSAGGSFDLSKGVTAEEFVRITDMLANKTNVPEKMASVVNSLKPEEYGQILDGMLKLNKAGKSAPQVVSSPYGY